MAKDLPYFKFFCSEWNDGDITLESYEAQGVFINICSYYWSNECNVNFDKLLKKFRGCEDIIDDLSAEGLFKIDDDRNVCISFLDEQKAEREKSREGKVKGGLASAEKRRLKKEQKVNTGSTEAQQVLKSSSTESQLLREDKIRREEKREDKKIKEAYFISFWNTYPNKVSKKKAEEKFLKLSIKEIELIMSTINNFVKYKPFKDYTHPNPMTYLNQERWNDEIKVNGKVVKSEEEKKELVTFYWEHEGRSNKRTYPKDKAEAYFKNQAEGGYHAVIL